MNAEVTLPRHGDRRGKCKPLQQHLQHHHANSQKSEHTPQLFSTPQHLDTADIVTRLSGRGDGKLPPRMRMMKSPSLFSIERQRRPRDAAVLRTAGKLSHASATIEAGARSPSQSGFPSANTGTINWGTCRGESRESPCWESLRVCPTWSPLIDGSKRC